MEIKAEELVCTSDNQEYQALLERMVKDFVTKGIFSRKGEMKEGKIRELTARITVSDPNYLQVLKDNLVMSGLVVISG